jgi:hypothetical protein
MVLQGEFQKFPVWWQEHVMVCMSELPLIVALHLDCKQQWFHVLTWCWAIDQEQAQIPFKHMEVTTVINGTSSFFPDLSPCNYFSFQ